MGYARGMNAHRSSAPRLCLAHLGLAVCSLACSSDPTSKADVPIDDTGSIGEVVDLVARIEPMSGTGGIGYNVGSGTPAASVPGGLVMPGPDTSDENGARFGAYRGGGYHYDDVHIEGFSQLHLHGVGLTDYGLLAWMPVDGMTGDATLREGRRARFSHEDEDVTPGRYGVHLPAPGVDVTLSTDGHAAQHRYAFTTAEAPALLLDLGHVLGDGAAFDGVLDYDPGTGNLTGWLRQQGEMDKRPFTVWFDATVTPAPTGGGVWTEAGVLQSGVWSLDVSSETGELHAGLWLDFPAGTTVELEMAVSTTDAAGATVNRTGAAPDVESAASRALAEWQDWLKPVRVWGGSDDEQVIFATSLYRSLLMPNSLSDRDGRYRGFDDEAHESPGHDVFSDMSLWDTYRTTHPLYTFLWPSFHADVLGSLHVMAEEGGGIPRWPLGPWEGGFMVGSPGHVVAGEAVLKGVVGDWTEPLLAHAADEALGRIVPSYAGRPAPEAYADKDWWSVDDTGRSVAWTQEVCLADHALGLALAAQGMSPEDATELQRRGSNWQHLYNPASGWFEGRDGAGDWVSLGSVDAWDGVYAEGNARQYVWMVPHDAPGLFAAMGGDGVAVERLETFFGEAALDATDDVVGVPEIYYWHGNEIDLHAPWLFAIAGRPDLTRTWVQWTMDTWYGTGGDGLAGNDDGGTLSAWYVWAAIGMYPLAGTADYVLGWPVFSRVELDREGGSTLVITRSGDGLAPDATVTIYADGVAVAGPTINHALLSTVSELSYVAE